jgi:haloalkane dehalogenase
MTHETPDKKFVTVNGKRMAYVEMGTGDPILLQHGNPTSSFLWRNIMPILAPLGRCIAVDLIGMGDSEKLARSGPDRYGFIEHREFLFAAWEAIGVTGNTTLVLHDWGSVLGFDWARRNADRVHGIAYMEGIVRPVSWNDWPESARSIFQGFRSTAGEDMILNKNLFIERVLPGSIIRKLTDQEMAEYRRPFEAPGEGRRPTLSWPRQIPIDGEPEEVCDIVSACGEWLTGCPVPKLFINAEPGAILTGAQREYCRGFANQTEVTVRGAHFIQEDSPQEIANAIVAWLASLEDKKKRP